MNMKQNLKQSKKDHPVSGQVVIDIILLVTIFWMILFGGERKGFRRGAWCPNLGYLPVLLVRWLIVPHRDWMSKHREHLKQEEMNHRLHPHHFNHHHKNIPHHDYHRQDDSNEDLHCQNADDDLRFESGFSFVPHVS